MQAIDGSLERLRLDFVDLLFCHRPDPSTPIEETVWAMSDIISVRQGAVLGDLGVDGRGDPAAWEIAERHHLHKPVMEQPQYNLFSGPGGAGVRPPVRGHRPGPHHLEPAGLGPADRQVPRRACPRAAGRRCPATGGCAHCSRPDRNEKVRGLQEVAGELGCTLAQLAIAWCASNPQRLHRHHRGQPGRAGARRT